MVLWRQQINRLLRMTDEQIEEIYELVYEALNSGQPSVQVQASPFRMTDENL